MIMGTDMRIGINGFGRIGRALARIAFNSSDIELVVVNEKDQDAENFAYLLKFDTVYGRFNKSVSVSDDSLNIHGEAVSIFSYEDITQVPWEDFGLDVLIEATGVAENVLGCRDLINSQKVGKVVVTNANSNVDHTLVIGANCESFSTDEHHLVSSSICDVNAILPVLSILNKKWGIQSGFITTLHPLLAYQNVTDGPLSSISNPGHSWTDYSLGRATYGNLIPKDTTAAKACLAPMPELSGKIEACSFRVPTQIVSASDLSINLRKTITIDSFHDAIEELAEQFPNAILLENQPLVSSDHIGAVHSCIVDQRRTKIIDEKFIKIVTWYDNEWGYSCRVLDVARLLSS